jgi:3-phenylpropionate/cinnamic acid dioxygenase small subunit
MNTALRDATGFASQASDLLQVGRELIEHEAVLLEEQRWDEWLDLYTSDCIYWVPAWRHDGVLTSDPMCELSLIYYSNRAGLEDRVLRIKSGRSPAGCRMARTTHLIANIRLDRDGGTEGTHFKASWVTHVFSPRTNASDAFFGHVHHKLVRDNDRWRIGCKKIVLQNDYVPTLLDIYCL